MAENLPIMVLGQSEGVADCGGAAIIGLELDIPGEPVHFRIGVTERQARLADIVPLARMVSAKITDAVVEKTRRDGGRIPCRKGCSACCSSLVPLSVPEVFRLREEILAAPTYQRRLMLRACLLAARRILNRRPPRLFVGQTTRSSSDSLAEPNVVSNWYASLKVTCPFHYKGVCTIYEQRPLACREHFVKGSARACRGGRGTAEVVEMPIRMTEALGQLASELEGTRAEAVMMPLAVVWCEENLQRHERTWPAAMMVERFVDIVRAMASKNSAAAVA